MLNLNFAVLAVAGQSTWEKVQFVLSQDVILFSAANFLEIFFLYRYLAKQGTSC
ncbi:hypothetical protein IQ230_20835 [Gloeocapsopsis crepidinum LEGE 06123]|uniref:Uncharacterized protein n=1 Tax=Gloeocapsopsis crepidinum LEGE 06123 TaxID=588587 RepID=A0ABR9UWR3_9CHRO|nr:hypothetical protein [Gloeocapsopsis crepidinum]MBE9192753.1 hypothetical protein [Gloeocapsopsis crepidinum LEGE 06123]